MPVVATKTDRFEHFNDDERFLFAEALRTHLATKREAFDEINSAEPLRSPIHFLSESDFGIPQITKLLDEIGF
jgi:hypothetical protein